MLKKDVHQELEFYKSTMPVLNNSRLNSCFKGKVRHNSVRQMNDDFKPDQEICVVNHLWGPCMKLVFEGNSEIINKIDLLLETELL